MYSLHLTHPKWTHTRSSGRPGSSWGSVPCSRTPQSWYWRRILPPPTIPAGPEIQTHNLPLTSPTRYPLGHDCPPEINMMWLDFTGVCKTGHTLCDFRLILSRILTHATVFWVGTNFSFVVRRSSCSVRSVYRGKREAISLSRQAIGRSDEFLTCQKFWSLLVRVSHSWSRATNRLP